MDHWPNYAPEGLVVREDNPPDDQVRAAQRRWDMEQTPEAWDALQQALLRVGQRTFWHDCPQCQFLGTEEVLYWPDTKRPSDFYFCPEREGVEKWEGGALTGHRAGSMLARRDDGREYPGGYWSSPMWVIDRWNRGQYPPIFEHPMSEETAGVALRLARKFGLVKTPPKQNPPRRERLDPHQQLAEALAVLNDNVMEAANWERALGLARRLRHRLVFSWTDTWGHTRHARVDGFDWVGMTGDHFGIRTHYFTISSSALRSWPKIHVYSEPVEG